MGPRDMFVKVRGITLVELVMAIALSGILIVGLMTAYSSIVGRSADPMVRTQAIAIAESFLEEASLKPFLDPATGSRCGGATPASREDYNNVCDYNGYSSTTISLPNGTGVASLNGYAVSISVVDYASLPSTASQCALQITVTVTSPLNESISLVGYRTDYETQSPPCS